LVQKVSRPEPATPKYSEPPSRNTAGTAEPEGAGEAVAPELGEAEGAVICRSLFRNESCVALLQR
jgi:hypothetical protein